MLKVPDHWERHKNDDNNNNKQQQQQQQRLSKKKHNTRVDERANVSTASAVIFL